MDQAKAFLQAIVEAPGDDAPRLVFADWLEEHGDRAGRDLAAFIRTQYALEDLPSDDPRRPQLEELQRDLLLTHEVAWKADVRDLLPPHDGSWPPNPLPRWSFRRGFVERVRVDAAALVRHADRLAASAPLRELLLENFPHRTPDIDRIDTLAKLAELPLLGQLERIDLAGVGRDTELVRAVLHSPRLLGLVGLRVDFSRQTWLALASSPHLPRLRELQLTSGSHSGIWVFGTEEYQRRLAPESTLASLGATALPEVRTLALAHWGHLPPDGLRLIDNLDLPKLRRLELPSNALQAADLRALLQAPYLPRLEELDLGHNPLGGEGCRALTAGPPLPRLRRLVLNSCRVDADALRHLTQADTFPALEALHLRTNRLGDAGVAALCGAALHHLGALHLAYNRVTSRGVLDLAGALPPQLGVLDLSWNPIGNGGVAALLTADDTGLVALDLSYCELTDAAAVALAGSPLLRRLRTLNLGTNRIGDRGVAALAASEQLVSLQALNLGNNPIGDDGARALLGSPLIRRLEALHLLGSGVSPDTRDRLREAFRGILG